MTAGTEVSVFPEAEIGEDELNCGLDMNSYQDLTSVGVDDSENSYVFVNGSDGTSDDPGANELDTDVPALSVEIKAAEDSSVSGELGKSFVEESQGVVLGKAVTLLTSEVSENCLAREKSVDGTQFASNGSVENQIEVVESQKDESRVEYEPDTSQDQVDLKSPSVITEYKDANQITQEISLDSAVDLVNLGSATEPNNIDSTVDQNFSDSTVDVINADSVNDQNKLGSTDHSNLTIISAEGQNIQHLMDAAECESQQTDVRKVNYIHQTLQPLDALEEGDEGRTAYLDDVECKSEHSKAEVGEVNSEQQSEVIATGSVEHGKSYTHVNIPVESNSCQLDHEGDKLEKEPSKDLGSEAKKNPQFESIGVVLDEGQEIENIVNENCLSLETGGAISPVLCEKQDSVGVVLDEGQEIENIVNENRLSMETGGSISPVLCGNQDSVGVVLDEAEEIENIVNENHLSLETGGAISPVLCENIVNEDLLSLETGGAISPVLCEKQDSVLVSHATDHDSQSEGGGELDVGESSHELVRSFEEANVTGAPAACMTSEDETKEKPIETIEEVSADCEIRYEASLPTESFSVQVAEVLEPKSCDEHVISCTADDSCAVVMNSLVNDTSLGTEFGIQKSASKEVTTLSGDSSLCDAMLQNVDSDASAVESRSLSDDSITSCSPTRSSSETTFSLVTDKYKQKAPSGTEISNEGAELTYGQSNSAVVQLSEVGNASASINGDLQRDETLPTESFSVQISEVLEPKSCDEHVISCTADDSCALVMNSLVSDASLGTEFGIQNSAFKEVTALSGDSSLCDAKLQNVYSDASAVESRSLGDDSITSCPPTTEISNEGAELTHGQCNSAVVQLSEVGNSSTSINRDLHSDDTLEFEQESLRSSVDNNGSPSNYTKNTELHYNGSESSDENLVRQECVVTEKSWSNETLDSLLESSSANVVAEQDVSTGTVGGLKKPFQFLVKMPRFDDEKLREQIRLAQLHVDEKTRSRDAIWQEIKKNRVSCLHHGLEFEAAKSEERAARKQVRLKRAEIEHLQSAINRVKNAISVEEIDARICSIEYMIEHETLPLKEEKNLIREIKQLKQLRAQLSSNIGSCDEVKQALDNREQIEENLKILKRELDSLKNNVSQTEAVASEESLRYEEESKIHKELRALYKAANEVRQAAYENLHNLKKLLYEKNKNFRTYKDDSTQASGHATRKDTEALHHLCSNQVEKYMELWNRDDEFRKEYVRCNMRSTIRRLGTLDGRSLGPGEDPPVLPVYVPERTDRLVSSTTKVDLVSPTLPPVQEKKVILIKDENPKVKVGGQKSETDSVKTNLESTDTASISSDMEKKDVKTKEELELARKEEEHRNLEIAARLKEQRRLEEIAKAKDALERKKRNAEKAQVRAELRAQKEAEQREKEKEKRLRKKERKKGDAANENESAEACESVKDAENEGETKEDSGKKTQRATQYTKQQQSKTKSIPPALRNKSKKKMQQWMRIIFTSFVVILLFLLGNIGFFASLKHRQNVA